MITTLPSMMTGRHVRHAIGLADFEAHVRALIAVEPTPGVPLLSCYVNFGPRLVETRVGGGTIFEERVATLRKSTRGEQRLHVDEALERVYDYIAHDIAPDTRGAAVFARGGPEPFFLALQFQVSVPDWIVADAIPNLFHLVELKDTYHRFVLLLMTEASARILEINLGAVTTEVWAQRPELRERVSSGWTKSHYQRHRNEQTERFVADEIKVLDRLLGAGGYTHLILAGDPAMTARMRAALPPHLVAKLVDTVHASTRDTMRDIVAATNSLFAEHEQAESLARVGVLERELKVHGLAAVGARASLEALRRGQVDVLLLAREYSPPPQQTCGDCGAEITLTRHATCPECGSFQVRHANLREELIRLAGQNGTEIEIVHQSDFLMELGGVGCLLRYRL
jgi:hypothetical protein